LLVFTVISILVLSFGQLAYLVAIMLRYAVPDASFLFRLILIFPLLIATAMAFALSWMAITGVDVILDLDALGMLLIFFVSKAFFWWVRVWYDVRAALRHGRSTRHRPPPE
jgi:hypothetical protein